MVARVWQLVRGAWRGFGWGVVAGVGVVFTRVRSARAWLEWWRADLVQFLVDDI